MVGHNCVLACLPAGIYGTTSATRVASDMRSSFPSIRFWLMVGIGGGAPSPTADIRLGDVVVSVPSPGKPAVVQYDYGKTVANGKVKRTGTLNNPPSLLLTAIAKVQANHRQHSGEYLLHRVSDMLNRSPHMADKYAYPGQDQDILFNAAYEHPHAHDTCEKCDRDKVITRPFRVTRCPVIHYGTIGSGNQVIKHAKTRDRVSQELGVLWFEMEASGLMNDFPSLAIRGICDYSDSHKNKQWQDYAAATAAAYARELLLPVLPPEEINLPSTTSQELIEKRKLWMVSLSFDQIQTRKDTIKHAHAETCKWLQEHQTYQLWLDTSKLPEHQGFLWIKGKPGTGKSTIMKHAFEYTQGTLKRDDTVIISFFINARGEGLEKSTPGMYRSLLSQLFLAVPEAQSVLDTIAPSQTNTDELDWDLARLQNLFLSTVKALRQKTVICFIDALDECDEDEIRDMVDFLADLSETTELSLGALHICFASRHYPHISFDKGLELALENQQGHSQDLSKYLNSKLSRIKHQTIDEIKQEILEKASGIFLWVVLVVDILKKAYDQGRIKLLRQRLKEVPPGLTNLFKDILTRDRENLEDLFVCIQWILYAKRPLTPKELYLAIQSQDEDEINSAETPDDPYLVKRFILSCSKGLAEMTRSRNPTIQFIHESVRDFLLKDGGIHDLLAKFQMASLNVGHELLKHCCDNYIKMSIAKGHLLHCIELPPTKSKDAMTLKSKTSTALPFIEYAVGFVLQHADEAEAEGVPQNTFLDAFPVKNWIYAHNMFEKHQVRRYSFDASFLYIFVDHDLLNLIKVQLRKGASINVSGERYGSPILAAIEKANSRILRVFSCPEGYPRLDEDWKQLLAHSFQPRRGKTLLSFLAEKGHTSALEILLSSGRVHPDTTGSTGKSLLYLAAMNGQHETASMLLDAGANLNVADHYGMVTLSLLIEKGHVLALRALLSSGRVHPDTTDSTGKSLLYLAAMNGQHETASMLLDAGANLDLADQDGMRTLSLLVEKGHVPALRALLSSGRVHADTADHSGKSLLHTAAENGQHEIASMLLDAGANLNLADQEGMAALSFAAKKGNLEISKLLIENGVQVNFGVDPKVTPLWQAAASFFVLGGSERHSVVKLLLVKGAVAKYDTECWNDALKSSIEWNDIEMVDFFIQHGAQVNYNSYWTPLGTCAEYSDNTDMAQALIDQGADVNITNYEGKTPLMHAAEEGRSGLIQLLLSNGAEVNATDSKGRSHLHWGANCGGQVATQALLDHGGLDLEKRDNEGNTALLAACASEFAYTAAFFSDSTQEETIRLLLRRGADVSARDAQGNTVLDKLNKLPRRATRCSELLERAIFISTQGAGLDSAGQ